MKQKQSGELRWTDTQIALFEKQMAARAAMGEKWICHWKNAVQRKTFYEPRESSVIPFLRRTAK